ncbi:hypothetical protein DFH07DRAFT_942848 [Mycena maculata]|uniref:Uncharacterized protein n=1 Tax=Mycena maculata TaxID=230809 RepID=A0AAD7IKP2_9AGAR|nr:hypothetical protein DFH07DRAFT_942848 [Mycena maculata]
MANVTELPNPFTPLAFLPPAIANEFEVSRYLYAATLGAYIWDIALNLGNDYTLLFKHRIRFPMVVYFFSRAVTFAYVVIAFIFQVATVKDCNALDSLGFGICFLLSQASTSMLFFLRATAVWHPNKIAYAVFGLLWLAVVGVDITVPLGIRGGHIGTTSYCIDTIVPPNTEAVAIVALVNDTVIFFAINYRILAHTTMADSAMDHIRIFFGGQQLSKLSRALVKGGQHFYLVALCANITLLILVKLPTVSAVYHGMFAVPALAIINAMACLVFRNIKFGLISPDNGTRASSSVGTGANPRSLPLHYRRTDPGAAEFDVNTTFALDVRVKSEVHKSVDGLDTRTQNAKTATLA